LSTLRSLPYKVTIRVQALRKNTRKEKAGVTSLPIEGHFGSSTTAQYCAEPFQGHKGWTKHGPGPWRALLRVRVAKGSESTTATGGVSSFGDGGEGAGMSKGSFCGGVDLPGVLGASGDRWRAGQTQDSASKGSSEW
jgi:hypothetical protein